MSWVWLALLLQATGGERLEVMKPSAVSDADVSAAFGPDVLATTIEAGADPELAEFKKQIELAMATLQMARKDALELRTDEAIRTYEEALNLFGRGITVLDDYTPMAQGYLELGAALIDARKDKDAVAAFRRAAALGKGVKPDPKVFNPEVIKRFAKAESDLAKAPRGSMNVVSKPESAEVFIDGRNVGLTPVSLSDLLIGEHWIVVRHPTHHRFSAKVQIGSGKVEKTEVFLRALPNAADPMAGKAAPVMLISRTAGGFSARYKAVGAAETTLQGRTLQDLANAIKPVVAATPVSTDKPIALKTAPEATAPARGDVHWAVSILPLGIGQFAERRYAVGAIFLATEILLLAANITAFWLVQADITPGTKSPNATFENPGRSEALKWVSNISIGVLAADVIVGGIDGLLHRKAD